MSEKLGTGKEISPLEIERRWNSLFATNWEAHNLTFEYGLNGEEFWNTPLDERIPIRGTLKTIRQEGGNVVIETRNCYGYDSSSGMRSPCEDIRLEIPMSGIIPNAHGDMLFLNHGKRNFTVFNVQKI